MLRVVLIGLMALVLASCDQAPQQPGQRSGAASVVEKIHGQTMGTTYNISWSATGGGSITPAAIKTAVDTLLFDINKSLSTYDPESELSRINRGLAEKDDQGWIIISKGLSDILSLSFEINQQSQGYFDVTVGPLVNLWGFGPDEAKNQRPSDQVVEQLLKQVGPNRVVLSPDKTRLKLETPVYVDLSAIAKGWGVDKVAELIESHGITDYLIEIGGELKTHGSKPGDAPWRIAIEKPAYDAGTTREGQFIVAPGNAAVATSGDYRNYFEQDGVRFSHTINPSTGRPITHNLASVTVIHPDCTLADGWATALNVAGPDEGYKIAQQHNLAAYFIIREEKGFLTRQTDAFQQQYGDQLPMATGN